MNYKIHYDLEDYKVKMDMINYCSQVKQDEAVLNLKTTKEFQDGLNIPLGFLLPPSYFRQHWGYSFFFNFWKKCFI